MREFVGLNELLTWVATFLMQVLALLVCWYLQTTVLQAKPRSCSIILLSHGFIQNKNNHHIVLCIGCQGESYTSLNALLLLFETMIGGSLSLRFYYFFFQACIMYKFQIMCVGCVFRLLPSLLLCSHMLEYSRQLAFVANLISLFLWYVCSLHMFMKFG